MKHSNHLFHFGSFQHSIHTHIHTCTHIHTHTRTPHQRVTLQQLSFGLKPESQLVADIKTGEEQDQKKKNQESSSMAGGLKPRCVSPLSTSHSSPLI